MDAHVSAGDPAQSGMGRLVTSTDVVVAPQLTVIMSTTAQLGVARLVKGAHAAWVVSSEGAERETPAVPRRSSSGQ